MKQKMLQTGLAGGILTGLATFLWFLTTYLLKQNPFFSFWGNLVILPTGAGIFITLLVYTKRYAFESFSFGQGMILGGFTTVILAFVCGVLTYISASYIWPGMVEIYKSDSLTHLVKNKAQLIKESSRELYNAYLQSVPAINAGNSTFKYIISNLIIPGLMFSILSALPLRRKKQDTPV